MYVLFVNSRRRRHVRGLLHHASSDVDALAAVVAAVVGGGRHEDRALADAAADLAHDRAVRQGHQGPNYKAD